MKFACLVFAAGLAGVIFAGAAQAAVGPKECNEPEGNTNLSNIALGAAIPSKVNFIANESEKSGCPSADAKCQEKAFVVSQNLVLFDSSSVKTGFICAAYVNARGRETDGWLPVSALKAVAPPAPNWFGKWRRDTSANIEIKRKSASAADLDGDSMWQGQSGVPNVGDISATIDPRQSVQGFGTASDEQTLTAYGKGDPQACAAIFKQLGPYLFASDNNICGGMNVTFTGVYVRR
jgi:hypothetical protein